MVITNGVVLKWILLTMQELAEAIPSNQAHRKGLAGVTLVMSSAVLRTLWFESADDQFRSRHSFERGTNSNRRFLEAVDALCDHKDRGTRAAQRHPKDSVTAGERK